MIKSILYALYDLFIPRFVTEDCAVMLQERGEDELIITDSVPMWCVSEEEEFDGIATIHCFTWLGIAFFPRVVGDIRDWK